MAEFIKVIGETTILMARGSSLTLKEKLNLACGTMAKESSGLTTPNSKSFASSTTSSKTKTRQSRHHINLKTNSCRNIMTD